MHSRRQRALLFLVCVALMAAALFSVLLLALESDHHCTGEDCPVCASLQQARQLLKLLGTATKSALRPGAVAVFIAVLMALLRPVVCCLSPVAQKVRLNN